MENFAVSAISITAMTPASTGSLTTTSAASGTDPAMLVQRTRIPASRISRTRDLALEVREVGLAARSAGHVADVGVVPEDDVRDPVQHTGLVATLDQQPDRLLRRHGENIPVRARPTKPRGGNWRPKPYP